MRYTDIWLRFKRTKSSNKNKNRQNIRKREKKNGVTIAIEPRPTWSQCVIVWTRVRFIYNICRVLGNWIWVYALRVRHSFYFRWTFNPQLICSGATRLTVFWHRFSLRVFQESKTQNWKKKIKNASKIRTYCDCWTKANRDKKKKLSIFKFAKDVTAA